MEKVIDNAYISLLQGVSLNLSLKLKNNRLGKKASSSKGSSVEFSDYREYMPGDDYRRIDWNAMARFEKLFLKLFMEEQESSISIFLDCSKSMSFERKREISIKAACLFAYSSLSQYDRVSLVCFNDQINSNMKNISSKQGFYKIVNELENQSYREDADLYSAVQSQISSLKKGYSIIISDFLFDHRLEEVLSSLAYKKQKIILAQILSKSEIKPNFEENVRLKDSENLEEINIDIAESTFEKYSEKFNEFILNIEKEVSKHSANHFIIDTDLGIEPFIYKMANFDFR